MKEFKKSELLAKNLPTGSYAAGCPTGSQTGTDYLCKKCERAR